MFKLTPFTKPCSESSKKVRMWTSANTVSCCKQWDASHVTSPWRPDKICSDWKALGIVQSARPSAQYGYRTNLVMHGRKSKKSFSSLPYLEHDVSRCLQKCSWRPNLGLDRRISTQAFRLFDLRIYIQLLATQGLLWRWKLHPDSQLSRFSKQQQPHRTSNFQFFALSLCLLCINYVSLLQVIICPKLQELLYYMHAFLTAKVASVDPAFMSRGNAGGRVQTWWWCSLLVKPPLLLLLL